MIIAVIKIIFLLGFLILIHELAHFVVARLCGVKVEEFSIGFGTKIYQKVTDKTVYTLRIVPLGGYVNLKGLDEKSNDADSYTSISLFKRILIILAGGIINILFGLVLYFILVLSIQDLQTALLSTGEFLVAILDSIKMLFTGQINIDQFMGPIGISTIISETKAFSEFVYLLALISLSLGITNLLPVPPLDGFKFLLLIIEGIRKKPFSERFEYIMQFLGFVILLSLSIYVAYNDVLRIF